MAATRSALEEEPPKLWEALTAGDDPNFNNGPDALLQFYDMNGDMSGGHYFIEDGANGGVSFDPV